MFLGRLALALACCLLPLAGWSETEHGRVCVLETTDSLRDLLVTSNAGWARGDSEALEASRRGLALIESGKSTAADWRLLNSSSSEQARTVLHLRLGLMLRQEDAGTATLHLQTAARGTGPVTRDPLLYVTLGELYIAEYQKAWTEKYSMDPESAEAAAAGSSLDLRAEAILDVLARAAALSGQSGARLRTLYVQRRGSETGLQEFVNSALSRPLP